MKYYLSSYKLGNETETLRRLISESPGTFGYIPNAIQDRTKVDPERLKSHIEKDMTDLERYDAKVELLDLRTYFQDNASLEAKLRSLSGVYVSGGNTFILRQAMALSGFDKQIREIAKNRDEFIYIAYSAGVCVLSPSLETLTIVDDPNDMPYPENKDIIWDGLGLLNFAFEPHYRSEHPESELIEKEVQRCIDNKVLFKAYRDGEVLIIE